MPGQYPKEKLTIIGGGIVGAMEAYFAYLDAKNRGQQIRITIYEKNKLLSDTTTAHLVPSLTPDEIIGVIPKGRELLKKLKIKFTEIGGLRVDDVEGINDSAATKEFIAQVECNSDDEIAYDDRIETLLALGKMSMSLWQQMYDSGDPELKKILEESNFNPCREPRDNDESLHDGYRIDLFHKVPDAKQIANQINAKYLALGYQHCKILTPAEVIEKDAFLADFCEQNTTTNDSGELQWKSDAVAVWLPGGYIDTQTFLPKFYAYLKRKMGQYVSDNDEVKDCLQIRLDRNVVDVTYQEEATSCINGIKFFNRPDIKQNVHKYEDSNYVFCPGEAVGSLRKFGFKEPAYAGFAGASLMLNIPISIDKFEEYAKLNHGMHFNYAGFSVAWQARFANGKVFIGVGGTKAFYGDQKPNTEQEFAQHRKLLQLNMINAVLPAFVSLALGQSTKGKMLDYHDLEKLEQAGIAKNWVGRRSLAFDGFPTLGALYNNKEKIANARCTTHLGSGGGSFSPATVVMSRSIFKPETKPNELMDKVQRYSDSKRYCGK